MIRLEWSERSLSDLAELILTHHLPPDTRDRIENSARPLERFPRFGPEISQISEGIEVRFLVGPWPWLIVIYLYIESEQRIGVVSIEDGRAATSTINRERQHP